MINNLRFELSFKDISQLEKKLLFCKFNKITNINIPCKGLIKKELFNSTIKYISKNYQEFNVTYHYSLYHQYSKNKEKSYQDFLDFLKYSCSKRNYEILLVSGSIRKNFDAISVLSYLKKERNLKVKLGIAIIHTWKNTIRSLKRKGWEEAASGLINSIWFQYGTDINELKNELTYLMSVSKYEKFNLLKFINPFKTIFIEV